MFSRPRTLATRAAAMLTAVMALGAFMTGSITGTAAATAAAATCAGPWVSNSATASGFATVAEFASGANGNVAPVTSVGGLTNSNLVTAAGLATDANGYLYVAAPHINAIDVYAPGASGDATPYAVIVGSNTGLNAPQGLVVQNGKLYVANGPFGAGTGAPSIAVFSLPLAAGGNNVAPVSTIIGDSTQLSSPFGLAVDSAGNIWTANLGLGGTGVITEFAPPPAGTQNVAPIRTITQTSPSEGLAISGTTLYAANDDNTITSYSTTTGVAGPVISGANTLLAAPLGIAFDSSGNLFVVNAGNQVIEFSPSALASGGNVAPIANITGAATTLDNPQFVYVPPCTTAKKPAIVDFDGNGTTDISVFRPSTGAWYVNGTAAGNTTFGTSGDIAVPADYNVAGTTDNAVFRPSTGTWYIKGGPTVNFGTNGDIPVPADYLGTGKAQIAVFRPSTGTWYIQGGATVNWGASGDIPVPADYLGTGKAQIAVFRPSTGVWYVQGGPTVNWGASGDIPVPADYLGSGKAQIAVFRPSTGVWYVQGGPTVNWGASGDIPEPGNYLGTATVQMAVFRPSNGTWYVKGGATVAWGTAGDVALPLPAASRP